MTRAHPLDDDAIERQRRVQRLDLLSLPDWLLEYAEGELGTMKEPPDGWDSAKGPIVERELRRMADEQRPTELLEPEIALETAEALESYLASFGFPRRPSREVQPMTMLLTLAKRRRGEAEAVMVPMQDTDAVRAARYVILLLQADALSPDSYRDPRMTAPR